MGMRAAIIRSAYFIQNDLMIKEAITGYGVYLGDRGLTTIDVRVIAGIAAFEQVLLGQAATAAYGEPHQRGPPSYFINRGSHVHAALQHRRCDHFSAKGRDAAFIMPGSKPRTNSITFAEDISHGFSIDPGPTNRYKLKLTISAPPSSSP